VYATHKEELCTTKSTSLLKTTRAGIGPKISSRRTPGFRTSSVYSLHTQFPAASLTNNSVRIHTRSPRTTKCSARPYLWLHPSRQAGSFSKISSLRHPESPRRRRCFRYVNVFLMLQEIVLKLEPYCTNNKILGRFSLPLKQLPRSSGKPVFAAYGSPTTKIPRRCVFSHRRNPTKTTDYQDPAASQVLPLQESYNQDPAAMRFQSSSQPN